MVGGGKVMEYEWFGPQGQRRSLVLTEVEAEKQIGSRVVIGFTCAHRYVESPSGGLSSVVYFQSDVTGLVWAVYSS